MFWNLEVKTNSISEECLYMIHEIAGAPSIKLNQNGYLIHMMFISLHTYVVVYSRIDCLLSDPGLFSVQFYTKSAVLNEFVQL